jgi:hypothetical protein
MPNMTLLDIVQDILSSMVSDEVNSITDTEESLAVAKIVRRTYYDMVSNKEVPEHKTLFNLTGLSDATKPTIMKIPDGITLVDIIKYDKRSSATDSEVNFENVSYLKPEAYLDLTNSRDSTDSNTLTVQDATYTNNVKLLIRQDENPHWYTSFDDEHIIFDSHDKAIDSVLTDAKTQCWGTKEPTFTLSDSFVPDIDEDSFPMLYQASKVISFADIKQQPNQIAAAISRTHLVKGQNNKHRLKVANGQHRPNYGRRS